MTDQTLAKLGLFSTHNSTTAARFITMQELAQMAAKPRIGAKAKAPLLTPYGSAAKTLDAAQAAQYAAIVVDHDHDNRTADDIRTIYGPTNFNVAYLAFTTSNHTEAAPRWKVVVPFNRPVDADTARQLSAGIAYSLASDPAQARKQQGFYAPNKQADDAEYLFIDQLDSRPWLQPDDADSKFIQEATAGWADYQAAERERIAQAAQAKPRPVDTNGTIIERILQAYDLAELLRQHGYKRKGNNLYLSPTSSSGMAGVHILQRDGKQVVYSHHGPACPLSAENHGGHALDVADVLAVLEYQGNFDRMIKEQANQLDKTGQKRRQREFMQEQQRQGVAAGAGYFEGIGDLSDVTFTPPDSEPVAARPALQPVPLDDVLDAVPEVVRHAVDPWYPKRHVTLFGGHGGMGKSMLALTIAAHVAAGVPFAGLPVEQSRVLFVSLEDEASIVRLRLRQILEHYNLNARSVLANLVLLDGTSADAAMIQEGAGYGERPTLTRVYGEVQQAAKGCELVFIDNASDAFDANENARRDVRFFIRALAAMARANDAAVVLLAHIDKAASRGNGGTGQDYSGSTAWHNSTRSRIALKSDPNHHDDGINPVPLIVEHQKANLGKKAEPVRLEFIGRGVLVPLDGGSGAGGVPPEIFDQSEMMRLLEAAIKDGIRVPGNFRPGNGSATQVLETLQEYPSVFRGKQGKKRANAALMALQRAKRIEVETFQDDNRNSKTRVVLTQNQLSRADDVA